VQSQAADDLVTADELAARLRCSRDWVYRRARTGDLPGAIRLESGWRFRSADIDAWLRAREQTLPAHPSGVAQSQPERRASLQKAKRKMKVTVKTRAHGSGGLEANLFWTDAEGRRRRVRRASPYTSIPKTQRWAEQILRELVGSQESAPGSEESPTPQQQAVDDDRDLTFAEFVPQFMAFCESPVAGRSGANTSGELANKQGIIDQHLMRYFGQLPLNRITTREIDAYVCEKTRERSKRTGKPLSASSLANHLGLLRRMLRVAHRWEMIDRVPEIQPPRKGTTDEYLNREETRALIQSAEPMFQDLILVIVRTGMRLGEVRELRKKDIHLDSARIRVARQRTQEGKVTTPKYGKARTVLVPIDALEVLRKRLQNLEPGELVFAKPKGYTAPHRPEPPAKGGEPWSHRDLWGVVQRATEAAGIDRNIGVHTLRHTFATHAVAAGVPLSVVSRQLGHRDIATTMRYAHHAPELTPGIFDRLAEGDSAEYATKVSGSVIQISKSA
jgi:excisionase family DNA binding protein